MAGTDGCWTLRFGAVMDAATVYLNGVRVGEHDGAYTPFEFAVTDALVAGENVLDVRVVDHPLGSREHLRSAHGKQGWMNRVFPSPPSLYATYGGIWQPVGLRRHGPVAVTDFCVSCDPQDLRVSVEVRNHTDADVAAEVQVALLGQELVAAVSVPARGAGEVAFDVGAVDARRWSPSDPARHDATVRISVDGAESDRTSLRFGLRTFTVEDGLFRLNGQPLFVRAALVQGFRHDVLYAEGTDEQIRSEVLAAKEVGLNVLRLHIKAFDPRYLDVCDELGMLVHCDIPVAEPIAHEELGDSGELAEAALRAVREQIRRDRSHPSVVLWSLMNELGLEGVRTRASDRYELFARALYAAAAELDPSRPIIENDWVNPNAGRVFLSPILTAHWYGRLSEAYLRELARKMALHAGGPRPLYVSEFGDWGLPRAEAEHASSWWAPSQLYEAIAGLPWGGSADDFVTGTQRYQGMSDRLQGEVIRAGGAVGWCLTELTDVPHEYNGLWSLTRAAKQSTTEISRLCQSVLPIVRRATWTVFAGAELPLPLVVSNDGPAVQDGELTIAFGGNVVHASAVGLPSAAVTPVGLPLVHAPEEVGDHSLDISLTGSDDSGGEVHAMNSYRVHVIARPTLAGIRVRVAGGRRVKTALRSLGAEIAPADEPGTPLVVGEGALSRSTGKQAGILLAAGERVVVLAQPPKQSRHLPVPAEAVALATEWGSTPFLFTTDAVTSDVLPRQQVLTTELLSVSPATAWTTIDGRPWAEQTYVGVFKPFPGQLTATVLGRLPVRAGMLWLCQLPLCAAVATGDAAAAGILAAVVRGQL